MAKGKPRPSGGRPPGRRGKAGVGPGPGYRTSGKGKPTQHKGGCDCPMAAAVSAVRRGKYRLAVRYAAWSVRLIAGRLA